MNITINERPFDFTTQKIVCVGRNYADHAKELNNPIPKEPLFFIKPSSTLCDFSGELSIPSDKGEVHLETELALLISQELTEHSSIDECDRAIYAVGLALDLTLRDLQTRLKTQGHPWERAKAFVNSCPVTNFTPRPEGGPFDWSSLHFELLLNGKSQQYGKGSDMLFTIPELVKQAAQAFSLSPGDIVLTGTPKGVCALTHGDQLEAELWHEESEHHDCLVQAKAIIQSPNRSV